MATINFDAVKTARLRKRYEQAVRKGDDQFTFEGNEFLVSYTKYLLEYLEGKFQQEGNEP